MAILGFKCRRCGGLMQPVDLRDWESGTGQDTCRALRCVACGDIVDGQILHNRFHVGVLRHRPLRSRARHSIPVT